MKKNVLVLFGGRSAEHEISLLSAKNVAAALDPKKYNRVLVGLSKEGSWYYFPDTQIFEQKELSDKNVPAAGQLVALVCTKGKPELVSLISKESWAVDIAFPVMHGTFGEDGCVQGLFKMMNLPFVGCGVLASANGMDKELMKRLLLNAEIPSARYQLIVAHQPQSFEVLEKDLGLPFFIKPANAGSSVGVHKIKSKSDYTLKIKDAFLYDHKVLAEEFVEGREIECAVLGLNHQPEASVAGEVTPTHEFYSYEAKYLDENGAALKIPAPLNSDELKRIQTLAKKTFQIMGCDGLTRVDFFLKKNGEFFVNEINTIPGFTKISMYPKMWEATGVAYGDLISRLVELGFQKHKMETELLTNYERLSGSN